METLLHIRVWILRYLLDYNDRLERKQEPQAPQPSVTRTIPSPSTTGHVGLYFYAPPSFDASKVRTKARHPLVINLHGGGLTAGLPSIDARWAGILMATDAEPVVVAVDYGLAPENPFPAALQDAAAAVLWLATEGANEYNLYVERIVLTGFSGGGTLALAVPLWLATREENDANRFFETENSSCPNSLLSKLPYPLRGIIAIYPGVDYRQTREPAKSLLAYFMDSTFDAAFFSRSPVRSPFVSPAAASDKLLREGLPEHVALYSVSNDSLLEPCEVFRQRLNTLGKLVSGDVEQGAAHAWDKMPVPKESVTQWKKRHDWFSWMTRVAEDMVQHRRSL